MAEIVASAVITALCEKLISGDLMALARSAGIDSQLNKWNTTLTLIQAVLADAGKKQITDSAVQIWLNNLHDLAYDIDDLLDDLATEALRRKLKQGSHASTSSRKVLKFMPSVVSTISPRRFVYGRKMSSKLDEITKKLEQLFQLKDGLGLNLNVSVERSDRTRTHRESEETSLVDESKIIGREVEKNALIDKLLGNEESDKDVSIVSIVGMGGLGKTTLAKVLYNQQKVKEHFELRVWVCVSDVFDVFQISNAIYQTVRREEKDKTLEGEKDKKLKEEKDKKFSTLTELHEALKKKLSNKKFLLVLDDVWNDDPMEWERLESPLKGAPGSKILVTTRNMKVTSAMEADEVYNLELLSDEDALSLLAQNALTQKNFDKHPTLRVYGEGIVKKCGRLPLALKTLGKALKRKLNGDEWENLLNSEIWNVHDESGVLPALRVSYYHLPPHLKLVFAYCSLLPKDRVFYKKELVLWWMAEGFLPQSKSKRSMESLGHEYFEELESKSFFQHAAVDPHDRSPRDMQYEDSTGYSMHDLINDLATSVAGELCFRLDDVTNASKKDDNFEKFRHFSLIVPPLGSYEKLKHLQRARGMRTLLPLPLSDGYGYLNRNGVMDKVLVKLPEQVSELYNLQSLLLYDCGELRSLPKSFAKLKNLRHLDLWDTHNVKKMPLGISELTSLQTLSQVIITRGANGFKISGLKDLSDLQGRLSIGRLDKVRNPIEAKDANLYQKKGLDVLRMEWSRKNEDSRNVKTEYEVLEALRPHDNLRILEIKYYHGTTFPDWVGNPSFDQLTELSFSGCESQHFPTLGHLPSLKKLVVEYMYQVTTLGFELLASTNSSHDIAFPSLEVLVISDCTKLVSLGEKEVNLKSLKKVEISHCDMLESYNCSSGVEELKISECGSLKSLTFSTIPSSVTESIIMEETRFGFHPLRRLRINTCDNSAHFLTSI